MASIAELGIVTTHVLTISFAVFQRTDFGRSEAPTPIIEELTTWVVETGAPITDAKKITAPEVSCVFTACKGRTL